MAIFNKKKIMSIEQTGETLAEATWFTFEDILRSKQFSVLRQTMEPISIGTESILHVELMIFLVFTAICACRRNVKPDAKFKELVQIYRERIFEKFRDEYPEYDRPDRLESLFDTREFEYSEVYLAKKDSDSLLNLGQLVISKMLGRVEKDIRLVTIANIWYVSFAGGVAEWLKEVQISER